MRALNPFTGEFYLETLHVARYTREMYCLFGGRHTHPSTIMPGGCSADITHQTCTDYYVRLMRYFDYVKRSVPMHDDLYDFFLQELPGYDMVGYRDTNLVNWGCFDDPDYVDYDYRNMTDWGRKRYITPGVVIDGELITTDLVEINLMIRILLGSSYFDDWENEPTLVDQRPARQPGRQAPPVEQGDAAEAAEARLHRQVHAGSSRRGSTTSAPTPTSAATPAAARSPASGARPRPGWSTSATSRRPATRIQMVLPRSAAHARDGARVEGAREVERDRARPRPHLPPGVLGADRAAQPGAGAEGGAGRPHQELERLQGARGAPSAAASTRPPAACSRTTWSSARARSRTTSPTRRRRGTPARATSTARPAPTRTRCRTRRSSRRTARRTSRASTSCGRCGRSTRACRAACTCTPAAARCGRWCTRPTGAGLGGMPRP